MLCVGLIDNNTSYVAWFGVVIFTNNLKKNYKHNKVDSLYCLV